MPAVLRERDTTQSARAAIDDADEKRAQRFFSEARVPGSERAELSDHKGSGYSRGHMAPAGDMPTPTAMEQSFPLADVVPQNAQHKALAWSKNRRVMLAGVTVPDK